MTPRQALKRHTLTVALVAVLLPLAILLAMQYRWLVKLAHTSAAAHGASLDNYLEAVSYKVEYFYKGEAERALNLSGWLFTDKKLAKAAYHFKKKEVEGASRLFVLDLSERNHSTILAYESERVALEPLAWGPEAEAIKVATAPWQMLAYKGKKAEAGALVADERDPDYRMILNPITDESSRLVGVAGMIVDEDYFRRRVLPRMVETALPKFFSDRSADYFFVNVLDGTGAAVELPEPLCSDLVSGRPMEAEKSFSFLFTDWKIGLRGRHLNPKQWAKRNFALNVGVSGLLALLVLAGVALALRTASREIKLSQMKSDFVSNVSHELRTPLASIRVFGEFFRLGRVESPEKAREYGEYIETESRRLTQLVNNLLDFSSIESGAKRYRFEKAQVEEVVEGTLRTFEVRLKKEGFRIAVDRPPSPLPEIRIDPGAIAQSLSNLLDNAVKYSNGGKEIALTIREQDGHVVISVRDWGVGIPRDEQKKIFDRFHRVSSGLVHDVKGSGLGLAIVHHIVEAHGGRVAVESRAGRGSTFSIHLPVGARTDAVAEEDSAGGLPAPEGSVPT